ncbi:unnamed protein product [Macrosiphum euphorbiae]|uniref:Uncharacterized protein n=1 Tax=Macrosiphum euphorbiae TaxID=13131 RepID=A0AAV0X6L7_9HEMI|nr:unnamed protein product [Macrosiphum euphorbiae]
MIRTEHRIHANEMSRVPTATVNKKYRMVDRPEKIANSQLTRLSWKRVVYTSVTVIRYSVSAASDASVRVCSKNTC